MVWSIVSSKRRRDLARDASLSRADATNLLVAAIAVAVYNVVGVADIVSTAIGVGSGAAEEANPIIRAAMTHFGPGWIAAKLLLQGVISGMVFWFPHRIVLAIFIVAIGFNAAIVVNNFRIVFGA